MESSVKLKMILGLLQLSLLNILFSTTSLAQKVHIVYMGQTHSHLPTDEVTAMHHTMLASTLGSADLVQDAMIYSYTNAFSAFAAKLSPEHISLLSQTEGVLSIIPNKAARPQTTHSWQFLGVETPKYFETNLYSGTGNLWGEAKFGEDIIIGMIDTGIWPESKSFEDVGLSDVPARWKGACVEGQNFSTSSCNKKLIGAKWFVKGFEAENGNVASADYLSARDYDGHGTHTTSTAGGSMAANANIYGYANGTAKGGAPKARVAVYKACWISETSYETCSIADLMAAMDEAVKDGVDLMSISIGGFSSANLFEDGMTISAFHAMQKGILVVFAAGNFGPSTSSVDHLEPWSLTVGASTLDRTFAATLQLGDSVNIQGATFTEYETITADLASAQDLAAEGISPSAASYCLDGSLDTAKTQGKIVFCLYAYSLGFQKAMVVKNAGGAALIVGNPESEEFQPARHLVLPSLAVAATEAQRILDYINNTRNPSATLFQGTTLFGKKPSPIIAAFSSVGPNFATPDILKPDIIAPGVDILAAWPGTPTSDGIKDWNMISGTSMATPHVAGVVALLKAVHPDWSPSAIKSAIMTTAAVLDNTNHRIKNSAGQQASPFEAGAGHISPTSAAHPGLVYDASAADYIAFLCSLGYNDKAVQIITGQKAVCRTLPRSTPSDLNQPSLTIGYLQGTRTIRREVTNVEETGSTYKLNIVPPEGVSVNIFPSSLKFKKPGEKKKFYVTLTLESESPDPYVYGSYTWYNGRSKVRSPIVIGLSKTIVTAKDVP